MLQTIHPLDGTLFVAVGSGCGFLLELRDIGIKTHAVECGVLGHFADHLAKFTLGHLHTSPEPGKALLIRGHLTTTTALSSIGSISAGKSRDIILVDVSHGATGIDHEYDVLGLHRNAPELRIVSPALALDSGFAVVGLFHRIEGVLARLPPGKPLFDQLKVLPRQLPKGIPYLMVKNVLALLEQFFQQIDQRLDTDRTLTFTECFHRCTLYKRGFVIEKQNHQLDGFVILLPLQTVDLLGEGIDLLLQAIGDRWITSGAQAIFLNPLQLLFQRNLAVIELTAFVGGIGENVGHVDTLAEITLAVDFVVSGGDVLDDTGHHREFFTDHIVDRRN